jgi:hypothetical protein
VDKTTLIIAGIDIGIGIIQLMCGQLILGAGMILIGCLLFLIC